MRHPGRMGRVAGMAVLLLAACAGPDATEFSGTPTRFANASGGPSVTATTPDTAVQDTTLDVTVSGSGFDNGSQAVWLLNGVPDARVHTNSTRYVSRSTLVANLTIAKDAVPATYDVQVTTTTGKKGIGTELFVVEVRDPMAIFSMTETGMKVTSDGRGDYVGGQCDVRSKIFIANGGGDAVLYPYWTQSGLDSPLCNNTPRVLNIDLGILGIQAVSGTNAADVDHLVAPNSRLQDFGFGIVNTKVCERVRYNTEVGGQALLTATGPDALGRRTWVIASQSPHYAGCYKTRKGKLTWDGVRLVVPFRITITEIPPP